MAGIVAGVSPCGNGDPRCSATHLASRGLRRRYVRGALHLIFPITSCHQVGRPGKLEAPPNSRRESAMRMLSIFVLLIGSFHHGCLPVYAGEPNWSAEKRNHWAWKAPTRPAIPAVKHAAWV